MTTVRLEPLHSLPYFVYVRSKGTGETVCVSRLVQALTAHQCDINYHILCVGPYINLNLFSYRAKELMEKKKEEKAKADFEVNVTFYVGRVNGLKFWTLFSFFFSNKMVVIRAGIHKMLVRIANREKPDQTASLEAV